VSHPLLSIVRSIAEAAGGEVVAIDDMAAGDVELRWDGELIGAYRPATLHGAVERLIVNAERAMGVAVGEMSREQKQEPAWIARGCSRCVTVSKTSPTASA
jgi:hypothetical protein